MVCLHTHTIICAAAAALVWPSRLSARLRGALVASVVRHLASHHLLQGSPERVERPPATATTTHTTKLGCTEIIHVARQTRFWFFALPPSLSIVPEWTAFLMRQGPELGRYMSNRSDLASTSLKTKKIIRGKRKSHRDPFSSRAFLVIAVLDSIKLRRSRLVVPTSAFQLPEPALPLNVS